MNLPFTRFNRSQNSCYRTLQLLLMFATHENRRQTYFKIINAVASSGMSFVQAQTRADVQRGGRENCGNSRFQWNSPGLYRKEGAPAMDQAEFLGTATGVGQTPLPSNSCLFACRLIGLQKEVLETLLVPSAQALRNVSSAESLSAEVSENWIKSFHAWVFQKVRWPTACAHTSGQSFSNVSVIHKKN